MTQHSDVKYRVAPAEPAAWSPYQELYQEIRETHRGWGRDKLLKETASRWRRGDRAKHPHGSNCIDIEVYQVRPNCPVTIMGTKRFQLSLDTIFPTAVGVFGPLQFAKPKTDKMLYVEYGKDCLFRRKAALRDKGNRISKYVEVPSQFRTAAWPATALRGSLAYLS